MHADAVPVLSTSTRRRRRAATAMEYLLVASLIIVVAMIGVNYFGQMTKGVTQKTSDAVEKAVNK